MKHWFQVAAAAALALLLAACQFTGDEVSFRFGVRSVTPGEVTLRAGGTADLAVQVLVEVKGDIEGSSFLCGPPTGVPAGASAGVVGCNASNFFQVQFTSAGTITLRVTATAPAPGRYTIGVPLTFCVSIVEDLSVDPPATCAEAVAQFVLIVPADGPDPQPEPPPAGTGWQALGGVLNLDDRSVVDGPALVVDAGGAPHAAFVENGRPVVRHWDGSAWQTLGDLGPAAGGSGSALGRLALAFDAGGAPVVAWTEPRVPASGEATRVQVRRWSGGSWSAMGPMPVDSPASTSARDPALLLQGDGLLLAWSEDRSETDGGSSVQLQRWTGSAWAPLAASPVPAPGMPSATALAAIDAGAWALGWRNALDGQVHVATGAAGPAAEIGRFAAVNAERFSLRGTTRHGLLIAVAPSAPSAQFTVQRWDGAAWQPFAGVQGVAATGAFVLDVALGEQQSDGTALLAWSEATTSTRSFRVRRWNGSDWSALGDALPALGRTANGTNFGLALAGSDVPLLATQVSQGAPEADRTIRVQAFR